MTVSIYSSLLWYGAFLVLFSSLPTWQIFAAFRLSLTFLHRRSLQFDFNVDCINSVKILIFVPYPDICRRHPTEICLRSAAHCSAKKPYSLIIFTCVSRRQHNSDDLSCFDFGLIIIPIILITKEATDHKTKHTPRCVREAHGYFYNFCYLHSGSFLLRFRQCTLQLFPTLLPALPLLTSLLFNVPRFLRFYKANEIMCTLRASGFSSRSGAYVPQVLNHDQQLRKRFLNCQL